MAAHAIAVIPARFGSVRFPGKPLADRTGKPMIQHVVERAAQATRVRQVVVATDTERIAQAVRRFGRQVVLTREDHPNGTSRISEAVDQLAAAPGPVDLSDDRAIVVNVQGDEPEIDPALIDGLIEAIDRDADAPMATVASPFEASDDPTDPNIVKVVVDQRDRAMYFSRSLIPYDRDRVGIVPLKHPGLYAYRRWFLPRYVSLPPTPLEQAERLEQLRALEHGFPIAVLRARAAHHGIDTPEQYEAFVARHRAAGRGTPRPA